MNGRVLRFPNPSLSSEAGHRAALVILETPIGSRGQSFEASALEDPEALLAICGILRERMTASPAAVRDEAEFFYRFIEAPRRKVGLFDERDYFLGELALLAGTACRCLSQRPEAWLWFDRSESAFRHTVNYVGDLSRLGYQRLAERMEERQIDAVLEMLGPLVESFESLGMHEDALKCRFLEGMALIETDEAAAAVGVFEQVCQKALELGIPRLLGEAHVNLIHAHAMLGETEATMAASRRAVPILQRLNDRIALGKVHWGLGILLRESGQLEGAIEACRTAQAEFESIGMRADVAALNLVMADLLLETGRDGEAQVAIAAALPVISELKMAPEGMAALSLLRESSRGRQINRRALRELHGYFEQLHS